MSQTPKNRGQFTSSLGFILASAGSAIGLGNLWKFPYIAANSGGGIFLVFYILFVLLLGVPIMMKIYEVTGAFENVFVFGFIVCAIIIVCLLVGEKQSAKLPQETVEVAAEAAPQE